MTIRRTRTLHARLREQEELYVGEARRQMQVMSSAVEVMTRFPSRPVVMDSDLLAVLNRGRIAVFDQGVLLLRESNRLNLQALGRDMVAIEASLEKKYDGVAQASFESLDVSTTLREYEEELDVRLSSLWLTMIDEMGRQQMYASRYDDDVAAGITLRWTNPKPCRVYGRKGKGVIPSFEGGMYAVFANLMWGMVNAQRGRVLDAAQEVVDNVG